MILQSCQNCWFNGLQYGALGSPVGYCSRHRKILNLSENTTCGLHQRKDLALARATQVSAIHQKHYPSEHIVRLSDSEPANGEVSNAEKDLESLRSDDVGELVSDYGLLGSKIESLSQLRRTKGARAEVALLSLSRGYVQNCVKKNGRWTSGLHLYWWTKSRLAEVPTIELDDLRSTGGLQLSRQLMLTAWSVIMLRLTFIEDIAEHASITNDQLASAKGLLDQAADEVQNFNLKRLTRWLKTIAIPFLDQKLDKQRFTELANQLHVDVADVES